MRAVAYLNELRKCVACGKLDVHHMVCAWCHNVRYSEGTCQLRHWHRQKPHCGRRREVAAGVSTVPPTDSDESVVKKTLEMEVTVALVKMEAAKAALEAARAAEEAALPALTAARAAAGAAAAGSKKEKKTNAKLVTKVKAAESAAQAAESAAPAAAEAVIAAARAGFAAAKAVITLQAAS